MHQNPTARSKINQNHIHLNNADVHETTTGEPGLGERPILTEDFANLLRDINGRGSRQTAGITRPRLGLFLVIAIQAENTSFVRFKICKL